MKGSPFKFKTVKGEKVQTRKGIGQYLFINKPGKAFDEGGIPDYTATLLLTEEDAKPLIDAIDKLKAEALAEVKTTKKTAREADDPYATDEKTGMIRFRFKKPSETNYDGKKAKAHVAVADARGNIIPQDKVPAMGSGSIIKINGYLSPYYVPALGVGVSLKLRGLQLVKLQSFGGEDAKFEVEEDDDAFEFNDEASVEASANTKADAPDADAPADDNPDF
jgi:hypothetical protein